jgi:hypothetical protein
MSLMQVNLVMWATQPVLTAALNKEYRTKKTPGCDDDVYPQIAVRRRVCVFALPHGIQLCCRLRVNGWPCARVFDVLPSWSSSLTTGQIMFDLSGCHLSYARTAHPA